MASECNPILDLEKMKEDFIVLPCKNQWDLVRTVWPDGFVRKLYKEVVTGLPFLTYLERRYALALHWLRWYAVNAQGNGDRR